MVIVAWRIVTCTYYWLLTTVHSTICGILKELACLGNKSRSLSRYSCNHDMSLPSRHDISIYSNNFYVWWRNNVIFDSQPHRHLSPATWSLSSSNLTHVPDQYHQPKTACQHNMTLIVTLNPFQPINNNPPERAEPPSHHSHHTLCFSVQESRSSNSKPHPFTIHHPALSPTIPLINHHQSVISYFNLPPIPIVLPRMPHNTTVQANDTSRLQLATTTSRKQQTRFLMWRHLLYTQATSCGGAHICSWCSWGYILLCRRAIYIPMRTFKAQRS